MGRGCGWKRRLLPDAFGEASKRTVGMFITDSGSVVHFQHLALYSVHSASVCVWGFQVCSSLAINKQLSIESVKRI